MSLSRGQKVVVEGALIRVGKEIVAQSESEAREKLERYGYDVISIKE